MLLTFFNVKKVCRPESGAALVDHRRTFSPGDGRLGPGFSGRAQRGQPFQVPTDTFELQFQPVAFAPHISYPPVTRATLPPAEHFLKLTPDRTEQPVGPHRRVPQFFAATGLAQNPVGDFVSATPFTAGLTPISLVGHDHFLVAVN